MVITRVDEYAIRLFSSRSTTRLDGSIAATVGRIYLYGDIGYAGCIHFYPDGTELPPPTTSNERVFLHFNLCQLHGVMEMLRTEEPLYVYFKSTAEASLTSGREPTGEEESHV
jgi:hypothetical protein